MPTFSAQPINTCIPKRVLKWTSLLNAGVALTMLAFSSLATAQITSSIPFAESILCRSLFLGPSAIFRPFEIEQGPDQLYTKTSSRRWELDDYRAIYRHSTLKRSETKDIIVEEFNSALDYGPSRMWIEALQRLGEMPPDLSVLARDPRGVKWSEIENFMHENSLHQTGHRLRRNHLDTHRSEYASTLWPGFQFALSQYPRRKWFTREFAKGAVESFKDTLRTASYIFLKNPVTGKYAASLRLVRVHNGLLRLKHVESGRTLEILGNAETTWGVDGKFRTSWSGLKQTYEVDKHVSEFLRTENSSESTVKKISEFESIDLIRLPMELGLRIELPRKFDFLDLSGQREFENGTRLRINGQTFEVSFGHTVLVEPGLFAIEKTPARAKHFVELMLWLGQYITNPRLPEWVDLKSIAYWTYNDLPLYTIFGFEKSTDYDPIKKYGVDWDIYGASGLEIHQSIHKLASNRSEGEERSKRISNFLRMLGDRGF